MLPLFTSLKTLWNSALNPRSESRFTPDAPGVEWQPEPEQDLANISAASENGLSGGSGVGCRVPGSSGGNGWPGRGLGNGGVGCEGLVPEGWVGGGCGSELRSRG